MANIASCVKLFYAWVEGADPVSNLGLKPWLKTLA